MCSNKLLGAHRPTPYPPFQAADKTELSSMSIILGLHWQLKSHKDALDCMVPPLRSSLKIVATGVDMNVTSIFPNAEHSLWMTI